MFRKKRSLAGNVMLGIGGALFALSGYKIISNISTYLDVDKKIEKIVAMAGGTATAKKTEGVLSMEELLEEAYKNSEKWKGRNSAILFKSKMYNMDNLREILETAVQHAHEIGMLDEAYKTGELPEDAPEWVRLTFENCVPEKDTSLKYKRLLSSELGGTVNAVYEAFNDVVSGGIEVKGEKVSESNMALVDIMEKAADHTYWNLIDCDITPMANAWAHTYFSLMYSDMGKLNKSVEHLKKAHSLLDNYSDGTDLAVFRSDIKTLTIGDLKKAVNSAIHEFGALDRMDPELKYTRGWWGQVQKKSESLGATNVFVGNMSGHFGGKYGVAAGLWIIPLVLGGVLGTAGYFKKDNHKPQFNY